VPEFATDPSFLMWASAYVVVKWTVGVWLFRRVRAWTKTHRRVASVVPQT